VRDLEAPPVVFSDPDSDPLSYSTQSLNPSVATSSLNGSVLTVTPVTAGNAQIIVTADDNVSGTVSDTFVVTVTAAPNQPPVLTPISDQVVSVGDTLNVGVSATDPDGDNITLTTPGLPAFGIFTDNGDGTGTITFNPQVSDTGQYSVTVVAADDGTPSLSDTTDFLLTVNPSNNPPVVANPLPDTTIQVTDPPVVRDLEAPPVVFSDPDSDPLSYSTQ
jgi:hypothetical protein